jgi:two-component system, LytTR family, response regulator
MIRAIIVENEEPNIQYLTQILSSDFPEVEVLDICPTVIEATEKINLLKPDLVFLDVELDQADGGFTILKYTRSVKFEVIFTTSHAEYAANAFKFCALDFLLKPFGSDDIKGSLERFKNKADGNSEKKIDAFLHNYTQPDRANHKIGIPVLGGFEFITVSEIIMCKSEDNCTNFHLTNKRCILATKTLKWVETLLSARDFQRVHDSYLINLHHITKYTRGGEGGVVELTDRLEADVSRRRKDDFLKALSDRKIIFSK